METAITKPEINSSVEHLFSEKVNLTGITEFGVSWSDITKGKAALPPQGARFNISFEGKIIGEKINGVVQGVDYLTVRTDGKFILNIQASIVTDDGESIFLEESGILTPSEDGTAKLHLNMNFSTASLKYGWLNKKQIWGIGEANMVEGVVSINGFSN